MLLKIVRICHCTNICLLVWNLNWSFHINHYLLFDKENRKNIDLIVNFNKHFRLKFHSNNSTAANKSKANINRKTIIDEIQVWLEIPRHMIKKFEWCAKRAFHSLQITIRGTGNLETQFIKSLNYIFILSSNHPV